MAQVTLTDVRTDLGYLLGEESLPSPYPASRDAFIQRSLERIARMVDFDFGLVTATISLTSGVGSLPTNARQSPELDVRVVNSGTFNDYVFQPTTYEQFDNYGQGDYRYYISTDTTGLQTLTTTETTTTAVTARYSLATPAINASIATNFPSSLAIAKGALIYVREGEDKDADTAPEDAKFRQIVEEVIAAEDRNSPAKHATYIGDLTGRQTGEIRTSDWDYPFRTIRTP